MTEEQLHEPLALQKLLVTLALRLSLKVTSTVSFIKTIIIYLLNSFYLIIIYLITK